MIYILAFFFPFITLAIKGMYIQAIFNFILLIIAVLCVLTGIGAVIGIALGIICVIWAWISIAQKVNKQRHEKQIILKKFKHKNSKIF